MVDGRSVFEPNTSCFEGIRCATLERYAASKVNGVPQEEKDIAAVALLSLPSRESVAYEAGCIECDCCSCTLGRQEDFLTQKSGIEEVFEKYNLLNSTKHRCLFLPKFHPELNYMERFWGRPMKCYCRLHYDNTFPFIIVAYFTANIPIAMIRRFARGTIDGILARLQQRLGYY